MRFSSVVILAGLLCIGLAYAAPNDPNPPMVGMLGGGLSNLISGPLSPFGLLDSLHDRFTKVIRELLSKFKPNPPSTNACSTAACKAAASNILDAIDCTANPCTNFYEFACGGWKAEHQIPAPRTQTGTYEPLFEAMTKEIGLKLATFNNATDGQSSSGAVAFSAYVYQQCAALGEQSNEVGLEYLKEVVQVAFGDWLIGQNSPQEDAPWNVSYVKALKAGVTSIFKVSIEPVAMKNHLNIQTVQAATLGLGENELRNPAANANEITAYKDYIRKAAKLFCGNNCPSLEKDVEDIVNLESSLAAARLPVEERRDPERIYKITTFGQLHEQSKFDFRDWLFRPVVYSYGLSPTIQPSDPVQVINEDYAVKAIEIINKAPTRTIANYIGWRVVSLYGPVSSEQFRQFKFEFDQVINGVKQMGDRKQVCVMVTYNFFKMALSRLFVEQHLDAINKEKQEATELANSIQNSLRELIQQTEWLDSETKNASLTKLNHVTKNIAYPEWILNNTELDQFYSLQYPNVLPDLLSQKNYLLAMAKFADLQTRQSILDVPKPKTAQKNWVMPPASVHPIVDGEYEAWQNAITIPAGILKSPFFDSDRPFSLNYGSLGAVIGHQFTHGLDDVGRKYDDKGNLHNLWTSEPTKRFQDRSQCFVDQYGSKVEKTTGQHLNARNTLGGDIADNGGLHESFHAFQNQVAKSGASPTLAHLPMFTSEQLFFISYANTYCSLVRPEKMKHEIEYEPHSPSQYRVNVPLANSADFAKAFNCPAGSPMNPSDKCVLW